MRYFFILSVILSTLAPHCLGEAYVSGDFNPVVYPNPVSASSGDFANRVLHIDRVDAESVLSVYNMIGEKIYSKVLRGDVNQDSWDLVNNNGVKVVTGIYVVLIQSGGLSGAKTSVQRVAILQ